MSSPLFGMVIMLFSTLVIFLFGILFKSKYRVVRYVLWFFASLLLIGIIVDPFMKNKMEVDGEKMIVGIYKIDIDSSKFGNIEMKNYSDLLLTAKSNNTFTINRQAPFFKSITGKWALKDDGDISFMECSFDSDDKIFQIGNRDLWVFSGYDLKDGKTNDRIVFKR
jgi:energy-coupling factor transporter transmembrane protein EcfT